MSVSGHSLFIFFTPIIVLSSLVERWQDGEEDFGISPTCPSRHSHHEEGESPSLSFILDGSTTDNIYNATGSFFLYSGHSIPMQVLLPSS
jgi:hypothetical protein